MGNGYTFIDPPLEIVNTEIVSVPEFPSSIILPLFMTLTLLTAIVYRKHCRRKVSNF